MFKKLALATLALNACDHHASETPSEEVAVEIKELTDWTCDSVLEFFSNGRNIGAVQDCSVNVDVTQQIRAVDSSLAEGVIDVVGYKPALDELLVSHNASLWTITGLADYVQEIPNQKVSGKRLVF